MAKLALTASPTFKSNVLIPVPGKKPAPVEFIFKGRTKTEFQAFIENLRGEYDVRRQFVFSRLKAIPNIRVVEPQGAFYFFVYTGNTGLN